MTLSPAAQAVVSAIQESSYDWGNMDQAHPNVIAAAALRAAACLEAPSNFDGTLYETGEGEFRAFLHYIAAELEGAS